RVLGADLDPKKLALAKHFGAEVVQIGSDEDLLACAMAFSRGRGVDAVLITASTASSDPVHQAANMCRQRGRIVLVGVTGLELSRDDFYKKELSFQVSCSYGPGRYDSNYEEKGQDYPIGFVRWTEQRNMEAVLDMMSRGALSVKELITHRFSIQEAEAAYLTLDSNPEALGIVLSYPEKLHERKRRAAVELQTSLPADELARFSNEHGVSLAFIGAGQYAARALIPAFKQSGASLHSVVSSQGVSGTVLGEKYGFLEATTDYESVLNNPNIPAVVIATRHHQHASQTIAALKAGKHVFVEKPLVITQTELDQVREAFENTHQQLLMVGFNRRFAPQVQRMKSLLAPLREPKNFVMIVNAGKIPADHWTQQQAEGGGRLLGEGCHFIDLLRFLAGVPITDAQISTLNQAGFKDENFTVTLTFEDGSMGTLHYFANGHTRVPKERLEVFVGGRFLQLINFRQLTGLGWSHFKKFNLWKQNKGQREAAQAFIQAIEQGKSSPIPVEEIFEVAQVCLELRHRIQ
ncbi:MAG: dehydrogenase, partial [Gammaproteobacteria bacterium]|nr:dehydrogenase [Gammaproteobacteria bacterium]